MIRANSGIYYGPLVYADYGQGTVQGYTVQGNLFKPTGWMALRWMEDLLRCPPRLT